jgi:DNA-binding CsgD family transcriptional regulator
MADPAALGIVGRAPEMAAIDWFLTAVLEGPAALVLEGEAGIGKTTLWEGCLVLASGRRFVVLRARAGPAESDLPLAGLTELLDPVVGGVLPSLTRPLASALSVALLRDEPRGRPPDRRAISAAVASAISALARDKRATIVAIDDFQWLDPESADILRFAARRLGSQRVGVLVARRAGEPGQSPLDLESALPDTRVRRLWLRPFTVEALERVLRSRAEVSLPRPVVARIHEASGGNPFYALEIARMIASGQLQHQPGEPLPLPSSAQGLVRRRLEGLPGAVRGPLLAAALMARPTLAAVSAVTNCEPAAWVDAAAEAGLIEAERGRVSFTHPLLSRGLTDLALPHERREIHARIAKVLEDPEESALHLARSSDPPDGRVAAALEESARLARAKGAPLAAAERLHQGFEFTPAGARAARADRAIGASESYRDAGSGEQAVAVVREALQEAPEGPDRARLLLALAKTQAVPDEEQGLLREALQQAGPDEAMQAQILNYTTELYWLDGDLARARAAAEAAAGLAARAGDSQTELTALGQLGTLGTLMGSPDAVDVLVRAEALEPSVPDLSPWYRPGHWLAVRALWRDDLEEARSRLGREFSRAQDEGNDFDRAGLCFHLTHTECRAGNLAAAARYADIGYDIASRYGSDQLLGVDCSAKALAEAHLGNADWARAVADEGIRAARAADDRFFEVHLLSALAFLEVSLGNYAEAAAVSAGLPGTLGAMGIGEPGIFPFVPDRIDTLVALGRLDEAEHLTSQWQARGAELERPRLLATGARCRAQCLAARGRLLPAKDEVALALGHHARLPVPLELGRTLLVEGQVLRRLKQKRPAREAFQRARSLFAGIGAPLWAARADAELSRIGGRAPSAGDLTPSEHQVAVAVASGATNREAADRLFLSVNTVEATLSRVYRKLGVRSRTELGTVLRDRPADAASPRTRPPN